MNTVTFLPLLGELLAKSSLILVAATLMVLAWRRESAAKRHLVWCAALCAILLLPATLALQPRWAVPVVRITKIAPPASRLPVPSRVETDATIAAIPIPATSASNGHWPDWQTIVVAIWAAGAGLVLVQRAVGSTRLHSLRASSPLLEEPHIRAMANGILSELRVKRAVELRLSPRGCVPLTWGTLRPVLMMPSESLNWSDERVAAALRHEAGHIARGDHFTRWIAQLACALYWPNPLVWFAARALRIEQEHAADDLVLSAGTTPEQYATQLFEVARSLVARPRFARCTVAMATPSTLETRMLAIVDEQRDRRPLSKRAAAFAAVGVVFALGLSTTAQLLAEEKAALPGLPAPGAPFVEIESKFLELTLPLENPEPELDILTIGAEDVEVVTVVPEPQFQATLKALNSPRGIDILSSPKVVSRSGQPTVIEVIREFSHPTDWEKEGDRWKPKTFAKRNIGVTLEVTSTLQPDGGIDIVLVPSVVRLDGFIDLDAPERTKYPATAPDSNRGNAPSSRLQKIESSGAISPSAVDDAIFGTSVTALNDPLRFPEAAGVPAGHRLQPVFSERKTEHRIKVHAGETIVISNIQEVPPVSVFAKSRAPRRLAVLVTARVVNDKGQAQMKPAPEIEAMRFSSDSTDLDSIARMATAKVGHGVIEVPIDTFRAKQLGVQNRAAREGLNKLIDSLTVRNSEPPPPAPITTLSIKNTPLVLDLRAAVLPSPVRPDAAPGTKSFSWPSNATDTPLPAPTDTPEQNGSALPPSGLPVQALPPNAVNADRENQPPAGDSVAAQTISLNRTGEATLNGNLVTLRQLDERLAALKRSFPDSSVIVRADKELPYRRILDTLEAVARAQFTKVSIVTKPEGEN